MSRGKKLEQEKSSLEQVPRATDKRNRQDARDVEVVKRSGPALVMQGRQGREGGRGGSSTVGLHRLE